MTLTEYQRSIVHQRQHEIASWFDARQTTAIATRHIQTIAEIGATLDLQESRTYYVAVIERVLAQMAETQPLDETLRAWGITLIRDWQWGCAGIRLAQLILQTVGWLAMVAEWRCEHPS